jgi:hypothetical protein
MVWRSGRALQAKQRLQLDLACGPRRICCKHAGLGRPHPYMPKAPVSRHRKGPGWKYVGPDLIVKGLRFDGASFSIPKTTMLAVSATSECYSVPICGARPRSHRAGD